VKPANVAAKNFFREVWRESTAPCVSEEEPTEENAVNQPARVNASHPSPLSVSIRRASALDSAALTDFMRTTFVQANGHCSSKENVDAFLDATYFEARQWREISDPTMLTLIAITARGEWAGFAQMRLTAKPPESIRLRQGAQIARFYVAQNFHGCGVAQQMMQQLIDEARKVGADGLWLSAWTEAARALAFYSKQGFRIVGCSAFAVGSDSKDNWVMLRPFAAAARPRRVESSKENQSGAAIMDNSKQNLDIALRYLASVGNGDHASTLDFYADDSVQVEFPNRLLPAGATRNRAQLREAAERGAKVMQSQKFEVTHAIASGNSVAIEAKWTGWLAVPFGSIPAGGTMTATFAIFMVFRDGKIVRQHNYDCFDPW
jgi:diamine N-acetyltransferase